MIIGIQGGRGSFNEQALVERLSLSGEFLDDLRIEYLFTSERVLAALEERRIDRGQFAVSNTRGGSVEETVEAKRRHDFDDRFEVLGVFRLRISLCLMAHPDIDLSEVTSIVTHPQVLAQCRQTLADQYPQIRLMKGKGDFTDPARVGEAIMAGELPPTTATVSGSRIADAFGLKILETDLQDEGDIYTDFELFKLKGEV